MCVQAVGLIAAEIERCGIATVVVSLLREVTKITKPPRALFVPFPLGFPLGAPRDKELQQRVITAALRLLNRTDAPIFEGFQI